MQDLTVVHYGHSVFDKGKFAPIINYYIKPFGGLWTTPVDSAWGWKDWCTDEHFNTEKLTESFHLKFHPGTKCLIVDSYEDLEKLPMKMNYRLRTAHCQFAIEYIDYVAVSKDYHAFWLTEKGQRETRLSYPLSLYGWDCETVLILDPDCCYHVEHSGTVFSEKKNNI